MITERSEGSIDDAPQWVQDIVRDLNIDPQDTFTATLIPNLHNKDIVAFRDKMVDKFKKDGRLQYLGSRLNDDNVTLLFYHKEISND